MPVSTTERSMISNKYDVKFTWNFTATSHGKGPIDGVGATLERHAMKKVITGKSAINNTEEFYNSVKDSNISVTLMNTCCSAPRNSFQKCYTSTWYNRFSFYRVH